VVVADSIDRLRITYGQHWHLDREEDRARFVWLLTEVLEPLGVHWALPCDPWCALGSGDPDAAAWGLAGLVIDGLLHQEPTSASPASRDRAFTHYCGRRYGLKPLEPPNAQGRRGAARSRTVACTRSSPQRKMESEQH
jgi:hypothetical protein